MFTDESADDRGIGRGLGHATHLPEADLRNSGAADRKVVLRRVEAEVRKLRACRVRGVHGAFGDRKRPAVIACRVGLVAVQIPAAACKIGAGRSVLHGELAARRSDREDVVVRYVLQRLAVERHAGRIERGTGARLRGLKLLGAGNAFEDGHCIGLAVCDDIAAFPTIRRFGHQLKGCRRGIGVREQRLQRDVRSRGVAAGEDLGQRRDVVVILRDPAEEDVSCGRGDGRERDGRACLAVHRCGRGDACGHGEGHRVAERVGVAIDEGVAANGAGVGRVALFGLRRRGHNVVIGAGFGDDVAALRASVAVRAVVVRGPIAVGVRMRCDRVAVIVGNALDLFLPDLRLVGRVAGVDYEVAVGALDEVGVLRARNIADLHADVVEVVFDVPVGILGLIRRHIVQVRALRADPVAGAVVLDRVVVAVLCNGEHVIRADVAQDLAVQRDAGVCVCDGLTCGGGLDALILARGLQHVHARILGVGDDVVAGPVGKVVVDQPIDQIAGALRAGEQRVQRGVRGHGVFRAGRSLSCPLISRVTQRAETLLWQLS